MFGNGMSIPVVANLDGTNNNGWGGDGGWWVLIILFALFGGWGGNGWGNNGAGNGVGAEVQRGFDTQTIVSKLDGISNGICSLGYDQLAQMNNLGTTVMQGFNATQVANLQGFNALQAALASCCCENRAAIAQVRYDMATDTCALKTAIEGVNRTIIDQFCQLKMEQKDQTIAEQASLIQSLNLAQSQANQNAYLINALRPSPVPAYNVPNPFASYGFGYGCGYQQGCCGNTGCGC